MIRAQEHTTRDLGASARATGHQLVTLSLPVSCSPDTGDAIDSAANLSGKDQRVLMWEMQLHQKGLWLLEPNQYLPSKTPALSHQL